MTRGNYSPIIEKVAAIYKFNVEFCEVLNKWIIKKQEKGADFYWDSNHTEQDFFDELETFFFCQGKESVYPY
jgi:hypothetical protein